MNRWQRFAIVSLAALAATPASADSPAPLTPQEAYTEIGRSGTLLRVKIDGDIDIAKLLPPSGAKRILLQNIELNGRLFSSGGTPPVALDIDHVTLRNVEFRELHWKAPLAIENSKVLSRAYFESAQFDAAFSLHGTTFTGPAGFSGARFAAPVDITAATFQRNPPTDAVVRFTDARFLAPARFDYSTFGNGVRFDTARFDDDAAFLGLVVKGIASWRNVIFTKDAEFRFCRLGTADFGDEMQMSVFMHLADFRGCKMNSLRLDYADMRGDALFVRLDVAPGDLTLRQASLRGARNDFSGLQVAGKLELQGAQIANLQLQWPEIAAAIERSRADSSVLRPLVRRLEELKQDDQAHGAAALLADRVIDERLARSDTSFADKAMLLFERIVWGQATGYGTKMVRIVGIALLCWLLLALPLICAPAAWIEAPPKRGKSAAPDAAGMPPARRSAGVSAVGHAILCLEFAFRQMFTVSSLGLRPAEQATTGICWYLFGMRLVGLGLLALMALTLTNVSPAIRAIVGKITG